MILLGMFNADFLTRLGAPDTNPLNIPALSAQLGVKFRFGQLPGDPSPTSDKNTIEPRRAGAHQARDPPDAPKS